MAILSNITGEQIEKFRGVIDFYMLRGLLPVARKWPRKPKPPYTKLQAEAQAVFALAAGYTSVIKGEVLYWWQTSSEGKRQQWTDTVKAIVMRYWKIKREIPLIVLDFEVISGENIKVAWKVLRTNLDYEETILDITSDILPMSVYQNATKPIFFTLCDDDNNRQVCPYIPLVL